MSASNGALPWFRMHTHILDNHKIHSLPAEVFRTWVLLLALARRNGGILPSVTDSVTKAVTIDAKKCAFSLRCVTEQLLRDVTVLVTVGLIDVTEDGLVMHDWEEHQLEPLGVRKQALSNAERQKLWRDRKRESVTERNGEVTPPSRARSESASVSVSVISSGSAPDARMNNNGHAREAGRNAVDLAVEVPAQLVSETEYEISKLAQVLVDRQPSGHQSPIGQVESELSRLCAGYSEAVAIARLDQINQNHRAWCECDRWQRGVVTKLAKWLKENWNEPPPVNGNHAQGNLNSKIANRVNRSGR